MEVKLPFSNNPNDTGTVQVQQGTVAEAKAAMVAEIVSAATGPQGACQSCPTGHPGPEGPAGNPVPITPPATIAPGGALVQGGFQLGDKLPSFDDIILPRVNIVQNIGNLMATYEPGSIVYNQQVVLFVPGAIDPKTNVQTRPPTPPVTITVFGFRPTRFMEKTKGGAKGLLVNSEAEVTKANGTLDYQEWRLKEAQGVKYFQPLADALVAIERPESVADDDATFGFEVEGKKYTLALWALKGTSYTAAAKRVFFTARGMGCLRGGYPTWSYNLSSREEQYTGGNRAWIPVCIPKAKNTPAFMEFVRSVLAPAGE